jgi:guanylate kinase
MTSHTHIPRRGILFVMSSPSGAGKTTLSRKLLAADSNISMSVSVTTRKPRPGEVDGRDYHFISQAQFDTIPTARRANPLKWRSMWAAMFCSILIGKARSNWRKPWKMI